MVLVVGSPAFAATSLTTDFTTDPLTQGWTLTGSGTASWTTSDFFSAPRSITATDRIWKTPLLDTQPLQWYRLSFKSKAAGTSSNAGSIGYCYWAAEFFETNGTKLNDDQYSSILPSAGWVTNEFRIRAKHRSGPGATLSAARLQVLFHAFNAPLFIDDVIIEPTTPQEAAQWADQFYDRLPAKLNYVPKASRWRFLPQTLNRLRTAQPLRVVLLGDSVQQDTANAPTDALLQRLYPGAPIEWISSTRGGTGVSFYRTNVAAYITDYRPNLLIIGGISNGENISDFQSVVDQVRAHDSANSRTTEIMIVSSQWSPNTNNGTTFFFSASHTEIDPVPTNNPVAPGGFRGQLLTFCNANNVEFLDMTGIGSQFIFGPATAAGVGAPSGPNGSPYSFWMRDFIHANDHGKMILGRILEAYFAPRPDLRVEPAGNQLRFSWPLAATGYRLETAGVLASNTAWQSNATLPVITNGQNVVLTNPPTGSNQFFYRLRR